MQSSDARRSHSLRASYWRKEILQLLCWIQGEGFGDHLDADLLERALGVDARRSVRHLDQLVDEGLLCCNGDGIYRPTEEGRRYGARLVADECVDRTGLRERAAGGCDVRAVSVGSRRPRRDRPGSRAAAMRHPHRPDRGT